MVWDQLKSSSFRVNEEAIETLFVCNTTKEINKVLPVLLPLPTQATTALDPKRSQNIAILLRSLNSTKEEVCEALLEGNAERLEAEQLEILLKMALNKEEEHKLKECKDDSSPPFKLRPEEKFLKALLDIPFPFKRVEAMLFMANFDSEVKFLNKSFLTLETACEELRGSRLFLKLLEAVLKTGNRMNIGTNRGGAQAFKLDTLLKLVDIKSYDGKTTLLHFVTEEIIRSEGDGLEHRKLGLQAVAGLAQELCNVKAAAAMDSNVLNGYVSKLAGGFGKINEVLRLNEALGCEEYNERFHEAMYESMRRAEEGIIKVQAQESVAMSVVKETTDYFHGDSAKEEAHPLRIFVVVRDFLAILERVCKEIGSIKHHHHVFVSSESQFPVPVNPTLSSEFN
ncbi:formin-like protein 1 [Zingiber officinale]|uniref:Formin-like protein n=1 Tax=Zingiber officinale TaxID=94328 RepID=A0A8J5C3Y1_ZINOF|nr:formin-like protein 1 [Zingiber officinale]KAG6466332.1 hypothetical protein ZIOFF_075823 [Zingiber officinale]